MKSLENQGSEAILTDAEVTERFKSVSQFIFEFQKQYFDSLKFSLNMWTVINSGVAVALISDSACANLLSISGFLLGAAAAGIGNMLLFVFCKDCLIKSYSFISNTNLKHHDLVAVLSIKHAKMYKKAAMSLPVSYGFFIVSTVLLGLLGSS